jgi:hypothetical protein
MYLKVWKPINRNLLIWLIIRDIHRMKYPKTEDTAGNRKNKNEECTNEIKRFAKRLSIN